MKGQAAVLNIFEKSKITTLAVSHQNNDVNWPNKIFVEYKNGVSRIV